MIDRVAQMIQTPQETVWPTLDLSVTPIILNFSDQKIVAFHLKTDNPIWKQLDPQNSNILYTKEDPWGVSKVMLHPAFPVDEQNVFVFTISTHDNLEPLPIMAHEWFHRYQMDRFLSEKEFAQQYHDQLNLTNLILMRLEEVILVKFLQENDELQKKEILKDFLVVSKFRKNQIHPDSWKWELHEQKMEGLADYISMRMFSRENILLQSLENANEGQLIENAIKWRHYDIGSALAIALDFLKIKDWKLEVEKKGRSQIEILHDTLLTDENLLERFEMIQCRYPLHKITARVSQHLKSHEQEISFWMNSYESTEGSIVKLSKPPTIGVSGGGNSLHIFTLGDGTIFSIMDQSRSIATNNQWRLETRQVPVYFQNRNGYREFKVSPHTLVKIDGKKYEMQEIQSLKQDFIFHHLELEDRQISFASEKHLGLILTHNGFFTIKYL